MAVLMKGSPVASLIYKEIRSEVEKLKGHGVSVGLAMIIVGSNASSGQYFITTGNLCRKLGIEEYPSRLPENVSLNVILDTIRKLNNDERISGILVFLPLPLHIEQRAVLNAIAPEKDVDGLGAISIGRLAAEESTYQLFTAGPNFSIKNTFLPCTPYGVIRLLEHYGVELKGKDIVIVGKSLTVGKSLSLMMLAKEATVTVCHRATKDLAEKTRSADILCVAAGKPGLITADMIKQGSVIVDIGINSLPDGSFAGDVEFKGVSEKVSHITPVPGGVGPVTIAILLKNTVVSTKRMFGIR
ncbi:MAG: bifunctional 5,10-methylenetetrahydrofolate dehydrogenase/5,10-methenyltetrahydrofolate cyclohydrolase [Thermodesulfovibrionales bacterium]|nr:bifunctional 5,10-methylenetetrahydrofolate dehydrogenase/5,10-methenyltetrahydrofolate cyclohydrolase [Thermodesulfovibrionales bacterium]